MGNVATVKIPGDQIGGRFTTQKYRTTLAWAIQRNPPPHFQPKSIL